MSRTRISSSSMPVWPPFRPSMIRLLILITSFGPALMMMALEPGEASISRAHNTRDADCFEDQHITIRARIERFDLATSACFIECELKRPARRRGCVARACVNTLP